MRWITFEQADATTHGLVCPNCATMFRGDPEMIYLAEAPDDESKSCNVCDKTVREWNESLSKEEV